MYTISDSDFWPKIKKGLNDNTKEIEEALKELPSLPSEVNRLQESIMYSGFSYGKNISYVSLNNIISNGTYKIFMKGDSDSLQNTQGVCATIGLYNGSNLVYEDIVTFSAQEVIDGTEKEFEISDDVNRLYIYQYSKESVLFVKIYNEIKRIEYYTNPLIQNSRRDTNFVYDNGWFYMLSSGFYDSVTFCRSKNLVDWEDTGLCPFTTETIEQLNNMASANQIYAPHLIRINGKWLLYVGLQNKAVVVVQGGEDVLGFYSNPVKLVDKDSINAPQGINYEDAFVQRDFDGRLYLFFGTFSCYRIEMSQDGLSLKDNVYTHIFKGRMGGLLIFRCGYWYLFNVSTTDTYVYRSAQLTGTFVDSAGRTPLEVDSGNLILSASEDIDQPFIMDIVVDNNGQYYAMLDAVAKGAGSGDSARHLYMQRLYWASDGFPYFDNFKAKLIDKRPVM